MSTYESLTNELTANHYFNGNVWLTDYTKIKGLQVYASSTNGTSGTGKYYKQRVYWFYSPHGFVVEPNPLR